MRIYCIILISNNLMYNFLHDIFDSITFFANLISEQISELDMFSLLPIKPIHYICNWQSNYDLHRYNFEKCEFFCVLWMMYKQLLTCSIWNQHPAVIEKQQQQNFCKIIKKFLYSSPFTVLAYFFFFKFIACKE